ncbi:MAG: hypothetical protein IKI57_07225 [Clostridia bacterium]|nr:hypothetical protein [Clostridia bacterium]
MFDNPVEQWGSKEKFHLLLIVIYRVRNNMFHGEKDVIKLKDQKSFFAYVIACF